MLRGAGRFVDDLRLDEVAHVVFVRSPHAHARITAMDLEPARKAPGVVTVVSAEDLDPFPALGLIRAFEGMVLPPMSFLAGHVVRAQGTPVAAVVAESAVLAADAAELARVDYTPLPGAAEADASLAPGAPPVVGRDDNRSFTYTVRAGDPERACRLLAEQARQYLADLQRKAGTTARVCVEGGKIAETVRNGALQHAADLVVIGQGCMHETLGRLRSNAYAIIRESPCPVVRI